MNNSDAVAEWSKMHARLSAEASLRNDSQAVAFEILAAYDSLPPEDRASILPVLAEWLVSPDERLRYDAAFIVSQRRIREMSVAVQNALARCETMPGPHALYEAKKLQRILGELTSDA